MLPLTFWQLIIGQKIILSNIIRIIRWWRRKVKNKRMKDRHKAMHQGMILILFPPIFYLVHGFFDCLPCQAWLITCVYDCYTVLMKVHHCHEWPCHCLIATPWFSYRFLHSVLMFGPVRSLAVRCMCLTAGKVICLLYNIAHDMSHVFDVRSLQSIMTLSDKLVLHCTILPSLLFSFYFRSTIVFWCYMNNSTSVFFLLLLLP